MIIRTVKFKDGRTDRIFGYDFVNGLSQEPIPQHFIDKLRSIGDGSPFEIIEEEYVPIAQKK
jgi:hypothetical protein